MVAMAASPSEPQRLQTSRATPPAKALATASETDWAKCDGNEIDNSLVPTITPPPLELLDIDPNQRLPPLAPSPDDDPDLTKRAEEMVRWAVSSKHENSPAALRSASEDGGVINGNSETANGTIAPANDRADMVREAARQCTRLVNLVRQKNESPEFLRAALVAIASSNNGKELDRLVTHSKLHAELSHWIMVLDPFVPPQSFSTMAPDGGDGKNRAGMEKLRELDRARRERLDKNGVASSPANRRGSVVQIAESSIRHKEIPRYIAPALPYFNYRVADAHLHLLVTLVSNNSLLGMSVVRSLWGMLTEFGGRWLNWANEDVERSRKARRRRKQMDSNRRLATEKKEEEKEGAENEGDANGDLQPPPAKRRKVDASQQSAITVYQSLQSVVYDQDPPTEATEKKNEEEEEEESEQDNERPVPGMSGLSVEFVRDAFYGGPGGEGGKTTNGDSVHLTEEIYSDRLASGRVRRLLLALANVFRLCPRSKLDLQRLMSSNFPYHKTCHPTVLQWYTHMCLQMVRLAPTFEGSVLRLFVDKALDMDVEIKINDKGMVSLDSLKKKGEEDGDHQESSPVATKKRLFQQLSHESSLVNSVAGSSNKPNNNASTTTSAVNEDDESDHVIEISERLDSLMTSLHNYILRATKFCPNSLPQAATAVLAARRLYRHLDNVFDAKVQTTDRSKFVQFAFFVLFGRENDALEATGRLMAERERQRESDAMQTPTKDVETDAAPDVAVAPSPAGPINLTDPLYRGFSAKLIDFFYSLSSHGGDDVPRQTAVCYLASFVSRASYVCPETVCECVAALLRWAEAYIAAQPSSAVAAGGDGDIAAVRRQSSTMTSSSRNGNTQRQCEIHALFYTACQAAFYMMCFRGYEGMGYYHRALNHQKKHKDDDDVGGNDPEASMSHYADPENVDIGPRRWRFLCGHALQPLKYCLESVSSEFLHLAEDLDLFLEPGDDGGVDKTTRREEADKFLEHLRSTSSPAKQRQGEQKKPDGGQTPVKLKSASATRMKHSGGVRRRRRTIISTSATREKKRLDGGVGGLGRGSNPLDSFFPFDPYLLQASYDQVRPYYRNWEDCILTMEHEEDEMTEEKKNEVCEDDHSVVCMEDDAAHSEVSDIDDEDGVVDAEEAESDDDEEEDGYTQQHGYGQSSKPSALIDKGTAAGAGTAASGVVLLREDDRFEMEIRRSRAMSTGSQCSW